MTFGTVAVRRWFIAEMRQLCGFVCQYRRDLSTLRRSLFTVLPFCPLHYACDEIPIPCPAVYCMYDEIINCYLFIALNCNNKENIQKYKCIYGQAFNIIV